MESIKLETYPQLVIDDNFNENEDYDTTLRLFAVPTQWLLDWLVNDNQTLDEFMAEYTWDDTYVIYAQAIEDGVLLDETIIDR